jgi:hypothetical protein
MAHVTLGQLHHLSGKAIAALPSPVGVKVDGRVVALLIPAKPTLDPAPRALGDNGARKP